MKVIITGAAGFIGSNLTERLLNEDHEVIGIDNFDDYYSGKSLFLEQSMAHPNFSLIHGDILNLQLLKETMKGADVVIHLAAQAGVRISVKDPLKSHMVNTVGTLNVLMASLDGGVKRVINSSSSSVYGNIDDRSVTEEDLVIPVSPYATSKLAAEIYCRQFYELYGLDTVSLRYFTVYGPRQRPDMAIRIFTESILNGLPPKIYGDGEQSRDFTYVDDVVAAICSAMSAPELKGVPINISGGKPITINRLVSELQAICGRTDLDPIYFPPQPGDVNHTWGDPTLAIKLLNWKARTGIREGLRNYVEWYVNNEERRTILSSDISSTHSATSMSISNPLDDLLIYK
ncbi:MAG: NAD-dependent epimerase/dehydratase family protein [Euryarchaeota archaeon]|nr:NAD-dependent epimerase/dehydratase family protein [Euryarchaeota archaeon]